MRYLVCFMILLTLVFSVGASPIRVASTNTILADLVTQVGGGRVISISVVPMGSDPHSFDPTPQEARALAAADLLIYNGQGLELWLDGLIRSAARRDLPRVVVSEGLTPIPGPTFTTHQHGDGDPHFWLDVTHAIHYVEQILGGLIGVDPAGEAYYRQRAQAYQDQLRELDQWMMAEISRIPLSQRKIVTYHDAFGYLGKRYGLEIVGFMVRNPNREPSLGEVARLAREIRGQGVKAIFGEVHANPKFVQVLASEVGVGVHLLYSDTLSNQVPTYMDMMKFNTRVIVEALI